MSQGRGDGSDYELLSRLTGGMSDRLGSEMARYYAG